MSVIESRRSTPAERSYTTQLFLAGTAKIGDKILEEAAEVVEAAGESDLQTRRKQLIHESADLMYHLLVMLAHHEITIESLESELARRFGISGLDEKASRTAPRES